MAVCCGVRGTNKDHIPRSVPFIVSLSSSGLSCWDQPCRPHLLLLPLTIFLFLQDETPGCGSEKWQTWLWDVALKKWQSRVELSPAEQSKAAAELSLSWAWTQAWYSGAAVQHNTDDLTSRVLSVIVFHCLRLGDGESQLGEVLTTLSFSHWPHRTKSKWQTPLVHKAPSFIFVCFCY